MPGPARAGPGVHKKCTFFWVFNNSPSRDSLGTFFGSARGTVSGTVLGQSGRIRRLGQSLCDPRGVMEPSTVRSTLCLGPERGGGRLAAGPDRRSYGDWGARGVRRSSSPKAKTEVCAASGGHGKEESVCDSQTCATTGVSGKMRSASQSKLSVQVVRGGHNSAVRQDLSLWARPDASAGPAGRGTRRAATDDTPPRSPR